MNTTLVNATASAVLRAVILGPGSHMVIDARDVAAYLLRTAAGLTALEVGQLLVRSADTVRDHEET